MQVVIPAIRFIEILLNYRAGITGKLQQKILSEIFLIRLTKLSLCLYLLYVKKKESMFESNFLLKFSKLQKKNAAVQDSKIATPK